MMRLSTLDSYILTASPNLTIRYAILCYLANLMKEFFRFLIASVSEELFFKLVFSQCFIHTNSLINGHLTVWKWLWLRWIVIFFSLSIFSYWTEGVNKTLSKASGSYRISRVSSRLIVSSLHHHYSPSLSIPSRSPSLPLSLSHSLCLFLSLWSPALRPIYQRLTCRTGR